MAFDWGAIYGPLIQAGVSAAGSYLTNEANQDTLRENRDFSKEESELAFQRQKELIQLQAALRGGGGGADPQQKLLESIKTASAIKQNADTNVITQLNNLAALISQGYLRGGR